MLLESFKIWVMTILCSTVLPQLSKHLGAGIVKCSDNSKFLIIDYVNYWKIMKGRK